MQTEPLATASAVIDALGGTTEAARKLGKSLQVITNWRTRGIPPEMFLVITDKLAETDATVDPAVFANMATPATPTPSPASPEAVPAEGTA